MTLTFCMDITSVIGNNSWKFRDDTMTGIYWQRCDRQIDRQTDRRTDRRTERGVLIAAWSQLKMNSREWLLRPEKSCFTIIFPLAASSPNNEYQFIITQTQDIFSLVDASWKHPEYPCFCILPPEFEVNIDIHKHENSVVIYLNRNKSPKEMAENSRLQKHGKHVNRFHLTKCTG